MANEIIMEMMQFLPLITIALMTHTLYIMYLCLERMKRISISSQYTGQLFPSSIIGSDGLIRPSLTYMRNGQNPEATNDVSTISLNVPFLAAVFPAYRPTEMIAKV